MIKYRKVIPFNTNLGNGYEAILTYPFFRNEKYNLNNFPCFFFVFFHKKLTKYHIDEFATNGQEENIYH